MKMDKGPSSSTIIMRNRSFLPDLSSEGVFICPFPKPEPAEPGQPWFDNLCSHDRLYFHQTMNSTRKSKRFRQTPLIPKDSLDFQLQAQYIHSKEIFPDKIDYYLQHDTCNEEKSFRVLRNVKKFNLKITEFMGHPIKFGGCKQKISPFSVKLMCSGPHSSQFVNNGYSRQPADGTFFRY